MRPIFALLLVSIAPLALSSAACSMLHSGASTDAGVADAGVAVAAIDAAPPSALPPVPDNVNQVARFPDEVSLNNATVKIADPHQVARNSVPGGALVATLNVGTETIQISSHENFVLCSFSDPKAPGHTLEGWIAQGAFVPGPTPAPTTGCQAGQVRLEFEDSYFCGRECKVDKDCQTGQSCSGRANLFTNGKVGAQVDTCTIPAPGTTPSLPTTPTATTTIVGVQQPPQANGTCAAKYILASDHLCHFECNKSPLQCPPKSRCTAMLTGPQAPVCEEQH
jgi:hypothetical protein